MCILVPGFNRRILLVQLVFLFLRIVCGRLKSCELLFARDYCNQYAFK